MRLLVSPFMKASPTLLAAPAAYRGLQLFAPTSTLYISFGYALGGSCCLQGGFSCVAPTLRPRSWLFKVRNIFSSNLIEIQTWYCQ